MAEKNTDRILDLIIEKVEELHKNQVKLAEEIQKTNIELTKISGFRHVIADLKTWKDDRDKIINLDDLKSIKEFYSKNNDVDSQIEDLYVIIGELRTISDDYKKFKTKAMTVIAVVSTILTGMVTIIGLLK